MKLFYNAGDRVVLIGLLQRGEPADADHPCVGLATCSQACGEKDEIAMLQVCIKTPKSAIK